MSDPILTAALEYAARGMYVFPVKLGVRGNGKKDVRPIDDWDAASSADPEVITGWFTNGWKGAALAIDCGKSGIVVADQDVSDGKRGPEAWEEIGQRSEFRVLTPTGGLHDYFLADPQRPVTVDNSGAVADGVDVRGEGGFVFAPPTIDPRGGAWAWELGEGPEALTELPDMPAVIPERLKVAKAALRPKPAVVVNDDPLFGPGPNLKKESAARELLTRRLAEFRALDQVGMNRSKILATDLAVLAGHGVGVFWTYEDALDTLMKASTDNDFIAEHGDAYVRDQAERGLQFGMREPWVRQAEDAPALEAAEPTEDAVDALLAEMRKFSEIVTQPPPRSLVQGLLTMDSESWLIGAPGSKKSFVAMDIAAHVAEGMPWQGLKVRQGRVVMLVAEGAGGLGPRGLAWQKQNGRPLSDDIYVLPRPVQAGNAGAWRVLVEACRRLEPALIVIDTQARVTVGLEENSAKEMGTYIEAVRALREATGGCVLSVHHTGRAGGDARGSSAIDGAQTTELKVVSEAGALIGKLKSEKQKDLALAPDIELVFVPHTVDVDEDGLDVTSLALTGDAFEKVAAKAGSEDELDVEPWRGKAPEPWTGKIVAPQAYVKRRILQVLHDHAGMHGLIESKVLKAVTDRWEKTSDTGWIDAWSAVKDLDCVVNSGGERWVLDRTEAGLE